MNTYASQLLTNSGVWYILIDVSYRISTQAKALDLPKTRFCKNIKISTQAFNAWLRGDLNLAESTMNRIDEYVKKFNF